LIRGHEEGHALKYLGLESAIEEIVGAYDKSDDEAIADLVGLYAIDRRKLGHLISPERRFHYERAKRWKDYQKELEETHKENPAKKGSITAVMNIAQLVEVRKRIEGYRQR
jgi:hypothetical protein